MLSNHHLPGNDISVAKYYDLDKDFRLELELCCPHYEMYDKVNPYPGAREVESCMKSVAPISRRTIRTGSGNRRRVGSCTMVGARS